ncbi:hypothetical protein V8G54_008892 [Vigna mungo]|uniref:Uncharacterized protein n=1 Tax=Vigna mungo TaxID=3915 RepID=A0AAQ3P4Q0_VIGMU
MFSTWEASLPSPFTGEPPTQLITLHWATHPVPREALPSMFLTPSLAQLVGQSDPWFLSTTSLHFIFHSSHISLRVIRVPASKSYPSSLLPFTLSINICIHHNVCSMPHNNPIHT